MHTDPIADLLTRIRNASKAHHYGVEVSYSTIKESILKILKRKKFIESYEVNTDAKFKMLQIVLKEGKSKIHLERVSKPGQRIYLKKTELKSIKSGLGFSIISTSEGLMTNSEAYRKNLGGEIICEVY